MRPGERDVAPDAVTWGNRPVEPMDTTGGETGMPKPPPGDRRLPQGMVPTIHSTTWESGPAMPVPLSTVDRQGGPKPGIADTNGHIGPHEEHAVDTSPLIVEETYNSGYNRWLRPTGSDEPGGGPGPGKVVMRESRNRKDSAGPVPTGG